MFLTPAGSLCCMVSAGPCCPCVVAPSLGHWHSCVAALSLSTFLSGRGLTSVNILGNDYLSLPSASTSHVPSMLISSTFAIFTYYSLHLGL